MVLVCVCVFLLLWCSCGSEVSTQMRWCYKFKCCCQVCFDVCVCTVRSRWLSLSLLTESQWVTHMYTHIHANAHVQHTQTVYARQGECFCGFMGISRQKSAPGSTIDLPINHTFPPLPLFLCTSEETLLFSHHWCQNPLIIPIWVFNPSSVTSRSTMNPLLEFCFRMKMCSGSSSVNYCDISMDCFYHIPTCMSRQTTTHQELESALRFLPPKRKVAPQLLGVSKLQLWKFWLYMFRVRWLVLHIHIQTLKTENWTECFSICLLPRLLFCCYTTPLASWLLGACVCKGKQTLFGVWGNFNPNIP